MCPEKTKILKRYTHPYVHSSLSHDSQDRGKKPKCPPTEEWIRKTWYTVYMGEYYSAMKKDGMMPFAATWVDVETLILSK